MDAAPIVEGLPPHLEGARYVFIPDKASGGAKDRSSGWYIGEIIKYIKYVPEVNSELEVRIMMDDTGGAKKPGTAQAATAIAVKNLSSLRSPPTDLIKLEDSCPPGILVALSARYRADQIYTSIGPILVSFNPFKTIRGLYDLEVAEAYKKGKRNLSDQPHVFALAAECLLGLAGSSSKDPQNQSLIICGESGSGKTEATKQCLLYLASAISAVNTAGAGATGTGGRNSSASSSSSSSSAMSRRRSVAEEASQFLSGGIESKILLANPLLEAWGNAKTLRNNNSSRFGKYIEVFFDKGQKRITGSANTTYLLEKSRVVFQEKGERNYHIFYQLLRGERSELLQELGLGATAVNVVRNPYLGMGDCVSIADIDDGEDFAITKTAYAQLGFSAEDVQALTDVLACILHISNVSFVLLDKENADGGVRCIPGEAIDVGGKYTSLSFCAKILGIECEKLQKGLVTQRVKSGGNKRNSVAEKLYKLGEALENKNAFAKELYCRCFDWIVEKVNRAVNSNMSNDASSRAPGSLIGVLDIFGFEIFDKNSLEQLCINLANESLQAHFNHHIFQEEIKLYEYERIEVPPLDYVSNADVLQLILGGAPAESRASGPPQPGLLRLLDDAGQVRGAGDASQHLLNEFAKNYAKHPRFKYLQAKRCFSVKHYAGDVTYDPTLFLSKNNNKLSLDVIDLLTKSSNHVIRDRFTEAELLDDSSGRTNKQSVTCRFKAQLDGLISNLDRNQPKYIRCVKPNEFKKPDILTAALVNEQLTYTGVFEAVKIMQSGYPFRLKHTNFRDHYHCLALGAAARKRFFSVQSSRRGVKARPEDASREQVEALISILGTGSCLSEIMVGLTSVFYRSQQFMLLESRRTAVRLKAVMLLQRWGRGASVRFLSSKIIRGLRDCFKYAVIKDLSAIAKLAKEPIYSGRYDYTLDELVENFKKIVRSPARLVEAPLRVCEALYEELSKLKNMSTILKDTIIAVTKRNKAIHEEFPIMERMLEEMKQVRYGTSLRYLTRQEAITVTWTDDPSMAAVDDKVRRYGIITRLKKRMDAAIESVNEEECEAALMDLRSLRTSRDVDDVMYGAEEGLADSIVQAAEGALGRMIIMMDSSLQQGRMATIRPQAEASATLGRLEFTVDSTPLQECIAACRSPLTLEDRGRSFRTRKMVESVRKLRDLRIAVERGAWDEVRESVKAQGWLDLFGIDMKRGTKKDSEQDKERELEREKEREREIEKLAARKGTSMAKRPSTKVARKSIVTKKKMVKQTVVVQMAQLRNRDKDPFFVDMSSGRASWSLSKALMATVVSLTHVDPGDGTLYYEDVLSRAVTKDPPFAAMTPQAQNAAMALMHQTRAGCGKTLGPSDPSAAGADALMALEDYLIDLDESGAARPQPLMQEIDVEVEVQDEVVIVVEVPAEADGDDEEDYLAAIAALQKLFVPAQLLSGIREEIKQMCIASLHFSIFPHLELALSRDTVSERIFFNGTQLEVVIDTEDLRRTLDDIEGYSAAFDSTQADYARRARFHLRLRQAAATGDLALLRSALADSKEIETANQDYANATKVINLLIIYSGVV